jgi:threonine/homoserine/homoserine lactone efflux protein
VLALVALVSTSCWALLGSVFERFMADNHRIVSWVMGALLVYCAVSLFHQRIRASRRRADRCGYSRW